MLSCSVLQTPVWPTENFSSKSSQFIMLLSPSPLHPTAAVVFEGRGMLSPMGISVNLGLCGGLRACGRGLIGRAADYAETWRGGGVCSDALLCGGQSYHPTPPPEASFHSCADQGPRNHCPAIGSMVLSGMQKRLIVMEGHSG